MSRSHIYTQNHALIPIVAVSVVRRPEDVPGRAGFCMKEWVRNFKRGALWAWAEAAVSRSSSCPLPCGGRRLTFATRLGLLLGGTPRGFGLAFGCLSLVSCRRCCARVSLSKP